MMGRTERLEPELEPRVDNERQRTPVTPSTPGRRSWWSRLVAWQRVVIVAAAAVIGLGVIGGAVAANLAEARLRDETTLGTRDTRPFDDTGPVSSSEGPPPSVLVPPDWVTFAARPISLKLPPSFRGGEPSDPRALAEIENGFALAPGALSDLVRSYVGLVDVRLMLVGELDARGAFGVVTATVEEVPLDWSLERFARASVATVLGDVDLTIDGVGEGWLYFRVRAPLGEGADEMKVTRVVLLRADTKVFTVSYATLEKWSDAMRTIFWLSAPTVRVDGHGETIVRLPAGSGCLLAGTGSLLLRRIPIST